jgi:RNA polymerase sigma-70 factor (ECF subfamily)
MDSPEPRSNGVNDAASQALNAPQVGFATPQGFEDLYRNTFPRVYAYVASLLRDRSVAEDVTALAFERAYRKRSRFSARRGSPEAWIFGIARNAALDELRKRKRHATLESEPADVWAPGPDEEAERAFRRDEVRAALATLDPRDRDLVALKFVGDLSNGEIARVLGISETNVGSRLHRTVEKLRKACQS